jgi:hypothetical protein
MDDQAHRLIVLWKSARDKYRSFFAVLNEVKREIGDDALSVYCREQLRISLSIILETRNLLSKTDSEIVKEELATAMRAEKAKRLAEREAQENERREREAEKEARKREKELAEVEHQRLLAEKEAERNKAKDRENSRQKRQGSRTQRGPVNAARQRTYRAAANGGLSNMDKARRGHERCEGGINEWVEGSVMMAEALASERVLHGTNNNSFSEWYKESGLPYSNDDRAALIQLGGFDRKTRREILESATTRSYQLIVRDKSRIRAV